MICLCDFCHFQVRSLSLKAEIKTAGIDSNAHIKIKRERRGKNKLRLHLAFKSSAQLDIGIPKCMLLTVLDVRARSIARTNKPEKMCL